MHGDVIVVLMLQEGKSDCTDTVFVLMVTYLVPESILSSIRSSQAAAVVMTGRHLLWKTALSAVIICLLWTELPEFGFSSAGGKPPKIRKQSTATVMRERSGLSVGTTVPQQESKLSLREESTLAGRLKIAGKRGRWKQVQRLFRSYTGVAVPVYCAAMQAAHRCGKYKEAAAMYRRLRDVPNIEVDRVLLLQGMKIFGKLQDKDEVTAIWEEVAAAGWIDKIRASARIDAAAATRFQVLYAVVYLKFRYLHLPYMAVFWRSQDYPRR